VLEQIDFILGEVMENLMSLIGHKVEDKSLKIGFDLTPDMDSLNLVGDPLRLCQILLNFAGNAIKFTEKGSITVRARVVDESLTDVLLRFEIEDTGIGISPEDQTRLFNAFEQADGSMTRKYGGTGLGLAINRRLALLMGGNVGVESTPGVGSTFWFTVRLQKAGPSSRLLKAANTVPPDHQIKSRHRGARILLAEDEPINREVSRGLLEDVGLFVDVAEDGCTAVEMASQTAYDLILMDMQMPRMNGLDATRAIRELPGGLHAATPILAMTANAFSEDRQACLDAGMNDHIGKPIDPDVLFSTLRNWLEGARKRAGLRP